MSVRPPADGLGLLIEAFDTHQTADNIMGPTETPTTQLYEPHVPPQQYYQPAPLGPDGYEHQLAYYIGDGEVPMTGIQTWSMGPAMGNGMAANLGAGMGTGMGPPGMGYGY